MLNGLMVIMHGLALIRIGMAEVNAVGNGISLVLGSFVPLLVQHREAMRGRLGSGLFLGLALAVPGLALCGVVAS